MNAEREKLAQYMAEQNQLAIEEYGKAIDELSPKPDSVADCKAEHDTVLRAQKRIDAQVLSNQVVMARQNGHKEKMTVPVLGEIERRDFWRFLVAFMVLWVFLKHIGVDPMEMIHSLRGHENATTALIADSDAPVPD